jgi:hypothetical protein
MMGPALLRAALVPHPLHNAALQLYATARSHAFLRTPQAVATTPPAASTLEGSVCVLRHGVDAGRAVRVLQTLPSLTVSCPHTPCGGVGVLWQVLGDLPGARGTIPPSPPWPPPRFGCSCACAQLVVSPVAGGGERSWGFAATTRLLPPALSSPLGLSLSASVRQLRAAVTITSNPAFTARPQCEAQWAGALGLADSDTLPAVWAERWCGVHAAPMTGAARSLLWRMLHRRLPLLSNPLIASFHGRTDACVLCGDPAARETPMHLFCACPLASRMWVLVDSAWREAGISDATSATSRLLGDVTAPGPPLHASAARVAWTSLRAVVLDAIWRARCRVLHRNTAPRTALIRVVRAAVHALRLLLWSFLPHLSPARLAPPRPSARSRVATVLWSRLRASLLAPQLPNF